MTNFVDLGIQNDVLKAIGDMGWDEPTPVQVDSIPVGLTGRDIFAQAQTGTGKTGAYLSVVLGRTPSGSDRPTTLIMTPTRELAKQVEGEVYKMSKYSRHRSIAIYGGTSINDQIYKLRKGIDIVVGTPGRLKDLMSRGGLDLSKVSEVVLDEADRMLDMGFADELDFIMDAMPKERHTMLFSATMAKEIRHLAMRAMRDPQELLVSKDEPCSDLTEQFFIPITKGGKEKHLYNVVRSYPKTIIFCKTKRMVDTLTTNLSLKHKVGAIHGDIVQNKRERTIRNFRNGTITIMVATDVAARGLDVNDIDCVVNYDIPMDPETYVHRIGRTGRAGRKGVAISLINRSEMGVLKQYEKATGKNISRIDSNGIEHSEPQQEVPEKAKAPAKMITTPKVVKDVIPKNGMVPLQINLGKEDKVSRGQIYDIVKKHSGLDDSNIGKVGLGSSASFVEVHASGIERVVETMMGVQYNNKKLFIQVAPRKTSYKKKQGTAAF